MCEEGICDNVLLSFGCYKIKVVWFMYDQNEYCLVSEINGLILMYEYFNTKLRDAG